MNTERNNNKNITNNNTDGQGNLINERPGYSAVTTGRASSPRLLHIEHGLRHSTNPLVMNNITMEEEVQQVDDTVRRQVDASREDVERLDHRQREHFTPDYVATALDSEIQNRISKLSNRVDALIEKLLDATSINEVNLIQQKLTIFNSQIGQLYQHHATLKQNDAAAVAMSVTENQQSTLAKSTNNTNADTVIPVFRITSIAATLQHDIKKGEQEKIQSGTCYPSLEAFFNTFENYFQMYKADNTLEHGWSSSLRMSFTPCPQPVLSWYNKHVEAYKNCLTWTEVKQIITEKFHTTDFQRGLRLLRMHPRYHENFMEYVDRYTYLVDKILCIPDNKFLVITFFNGLPKSFRKVIFDKISTLTDHKSDKVDPFPMTWNDTIQLFNQHKVVLSSELGKIYESYGTEESYLKALKRDEKAKPSSENEEVSKTNKSTSARSDSNNNSSRKRKPAVDEEHKYQRQSKISKHGPNGSNASFGVPQRNICYFCYKEPFSPVHRNNCDAYIKYCDTRSRNNLRSNTYNRSSNYGYTPSSGKQIS